MVPTDVPGGDVGFGPSRSRGRRELRAAAAALILVIGGAAAIAIKRGDDRGRVASQDPVTTGASTTAATTAPGDAARPLSDVAYPIGEYEGEGYRIHALFEDGATANLVPPTPAWQRVRVGDHEGYHAALPNSAMSELWVVFDDGVVVLRGRSLPRERLIAAGATVTRDPDTGRYTMPAPPGWTTLWTTPPDVDSPVPESDVVGRFVSTADPAGKNFTVFWYPGWDETNVAEGAELVQVGDGEGYIGTIAPEASDLSPLWITYRDGVVEPASGRHVPRRVDRGWRRRQANAGHGPVRDHTATRVRAGVLRWRLRGVRTGVIGTSSISAPTAEVAGDAERRSGPIPTARRPDVLGRMICARVLARSACSQSARDRQICRGMCCPGSALGSGAWVLSDPRHRQRLKAP